MSKSYCSYDLVLWTTSGKVFFGPLIIERICYPLGCDLPYPVVGAGKSNNYFKEPIKASESFIVPLKPFITLYSDCYTFIMALNPS